jgi:Lrp/AsnC family transcriptional regulator, regulator for asnA, asnC and gidA
MLKKSNNIESLIKLDNTDKDIIRLLQESPQRPNSNIATIKGVSESTVKNRINRLTKNRILNTYATLNPAAFGYRSIFSLGFRVSPGKRDSVTKQLLALNEISFIGHTIGRFDVIVEIRLKDSEQLLELVFNIGKSIPGILSTESFYILDVKRDYYDWKLPDGKLDKIRKPPGKSISDPMIHNNIKKPVQIDETDYQIITLLQENGRIWNADIARSIALSKTTVKNRLDRLMSHNVLKIVAVLNPKAAGYNIRVLIDIKVNPLKLETVGKKLLIREEVINMAYVSGSFDIALEVILKNIDDLYTFVLEDLEQIPGILKYDIVHLTRIEMMEYEWKLPVDALHSK